MSQPIPNYDLGILITIDISVALATVLIVVIGIGGIMRQNIRSQQIMLEVARIAQRIDARLRRDFPDIGQDLGD